VSSCGSASTARAARWRRSASELGLTRERVRQLEQSAFAKLAGDLEDVVPAAATNSPTPPRREPARAAPPRRSG
jgi:hypothetical protein